MKRLAVEPLGIAARVLAAIVGGYGLASLMSIVLARLLPLPHASAVMIGMLASFLFHACCALWAFAARTTLAAWLGLVVPGVFLALAAWLLGPAPLP